MNNTPQQVWLRTLGYTIWLHGGALTNWPAPQQAAAVQPLPATAHPSPDTAANDGPFSKPMLPAVENTTAHTPTALPPVTDRLFLALLRASGADPNDPHIHHLISGWPLDELRTNPATKRKFWPQLRALRRQQRHAKP